MGANQSNRWLCYTEYDNLRRAAHQHWYVTTYDNASLTNPAETLYLLDSRIQGVVWRCNWAAFEASLGVYDFLTLTSALQRASLAGKQLVARLWCKTYYGYDNPGGTIPTYLNIPAYIATDNATYGGAAFRGGIYPVYLSGAASGWGPFFETPAVMTRMKALLTAMAAAVQASPYYSAFAGISAPDESTRSAYNGSGLPAPITEAATTQANKDIYTHCASVFGADKVWPVINYVDSENSIATANVNTRALADWSVAQGYNFSFSDVFRIPSQVASSQPVYWMNRPAVATGRKVMVTIDQLSHGADDAGLTAREIENAQQSYRLGADITAWFPYPAGGANYWTAIKAAIDATTAFRP